MAKKKTKESEETIAATPPPAMVEDQKPHKSPWPYIALAIAIPALVLGGFALYEQQSTARTIAGIETRIAETGEVTADALAETEKRIMDEIARIRSEVESLPAPATFDASRIENRLTVIESHIKELAAAAAAPPSPQPQPDEVAAATAEKSSSWSWRRLFGDALKITPVDEGN